MAIIELYSSRKKKASDVIDDVYIYDDTTEKLRNQVLQIIFDILDKYKNSNISLDDVDDYEYIQSILCREYGVFSLCNARDSRADLVQWFLTKANLEQELDFIELTFRYIEGYVSQNSGYYISNRGVQLSKKVIDDSIDELNYRFKENSIGYQFIESKIIRVDSQFIHNETVKPLLFLLSNSSCYGGVMDEFISAHEHYRHGNYKECLVDCLKSFESLMKAIHDKKGWVYDSKRATAKDLINSCLKNGLVPQYLQNQLSAINNMLESGIPTIRNKEAGHGQGTDVSKVEIHLCSYMLHITASNLLFLSECETNL